MSTNYSTAHTHTPYRQYAYTPQKKDCRFGNNDSSYYYGGHHGFHAVEAQPEGYPLMSASEMYHVQHTAPPKERSCIRKPVNIFSLVTGFLGTAAVAAAEILPHTALIANPVVKAALKPLLYGGAGSLTVSIGTQLLKCLSRTNCSGPDPGCCATCSLPDCGGCDIPICC